MIENFKRGIAAFARDMQVSVPLRVTFAIALAAFMLAIAVATGFRVG